jgi:hypothetical protein
MKSLKALPYIATIVLITIIFTGCSKEKRIERTLFKRGGEWNIVSATWEKEGYTDTGWAVISGTNNDVGIFSFDKDKEGFCEYKIDGVSYSSNITWNVVNETVYISSNQSFWDLWDDKTVTFEGTDPDKKSMTLQGTHEETDWSTGYETTITATFTLEKD